MIKAAITWAALSAVMLMGVTVCAGVMRVLADIVTGFGLEEQVLVWMAVGLVSLIAALLFLYGTMEWFNRQFNVRGAAK